MKAQGERAIASFHSHPEGSATLSYDDRRHVFAVAPTAIIIGLTARAKSAVVAGFARARNGKEISVNVVIG
jgi:proteasome lid subunit RPN8/RPN11